MQHRILIIMLILISITSSVNALQLIDAETNQPIDDSYILVKIYETGEEIKGKSQEGYIELPSGKHKIGVFVDSLETEGKDYFAEGQVDYDASLSVFPTASLKGRIIHDGIVASNSKIRIDCDKDYGIEYPKETDSLGYFSIAYIPTGKCRVNAQKNKKYNYIEISLKHGENKEIEIELNRELKTNYWTYAGLIAITIILLIIWKRKPKKKEEKETKIHDYRKDILRTLNNDEKAIVEYLINNNYVAIQPKIYKATEIPKTTLARQIINLENKNIVETRRKRKVKEVKLTDWFLKKA